IAHGPALVRAPIPLGRKLNCLAFGSQFFLPPLLLASFLTSLALVATGAQASWDVPLALFLGYEVGLVVLVLAGVAADGRRGVRLLPSCLRAALSLTHWALVVPAALLRIAFGPGTVRYRKTVRSPAERQRRVTVDRLRPAPSRKPAEVPRPTQRRT